MKTCAEIHRLVATGEVEEVGWLPRLSIRLHLMMCVNCRRYRDQLRLLGRWARQAWGPRPGDEVVLDRLRATILTNLPDTSPAGDGDGLTP